MNQTDLDLMTACVQKAVKETVNGKIDSLTKKVDDHIERVEPYLQGVMGLRILGQGLVWLGSLAIAWVAIKGFSPKL